jgi:uncharacterized protein (UPF0333 family)
MDGVDLNRKEIKKELLVSIVLLVVGALVVGFVLGQSFNASQQNSVSSFIGEDKNFLVGLAYNGGFCERQGFMSAVLPQKVADTNEVYGIPVCIERRDINAK